MLLLAQSPEREQQELGQSKVGKVEAQQITWSMLLQNKEEWYIHDYVDKKRHMACWVLTIPALI